MRRHRLHLLGLLAVLFSAALSYSKEAAAGHKVGRKELILSLGDSYPWRGVEPKNQNLRVMVWYPAVSNAEEELHKFGPPSPTSPIGPWSAGCSALGVEPLKSQNLFPLIVLSHGTGGSPEMMAWLGTQLASQGFVTVAVDHPGNSSRLKSNFEPDYTPQGFSLWGERAKDLSTVIDHMLADTEFRPLIDTQRIGAAGFSLGGSTVIALAGGEMDRQRFLDFCKRCPENGSCVGPPEYLKGKNVELNVDVEQLAKNDKCFRDALHHTGEHRHDPRIQAVFAIAPALGPSFDTVSLQKIKIPVEIVAGQMDHVMPIHCNAQWLDQHIPQSRFTPFPNVGHYIFLAEGTKEGIAELPLMYTDDCVVRDGIHCQTAAMACQFFSRYLK